MELMDWIGCNVFVKLVDGAVYSGKILNVDNDFVTMKDKFGKRVIFTISKIQKIKEEDLKKVKECGK